MISIGSKARFFSHWPFIYCKNTNETASLPLVETLVQGVFPFEQFIKQTSSRFFSHLPIFPLWLSIRKVKPLFELNSQKRWSSTRYVTESVSNCLFRRDEAGKFLVMLRCILNTYLMHYPISVCTFLFCMIPHQEKCAHFNPIEIKGNFTWFRKSRKKYSHWLLYIEFKLIIDEVIRVTTKDPG